MADGSHRSEWAPKTLDDLDRIIDLFVYEAAPEGQSKVIRGGAGAYCYFGPPECARLENTALEGWVDGLLEHVREAGRHQEDFRVEYQGTAWRACRDVSDLGTQISMRRLAATVPTLSELRLGEPMIRDLLQSAWLNEGGLVVFCGLTGQGKTTLASATARSRLERFSGRCVNVADVCELPLEGLWEHGSCRQLRVDYFAEDPVRRGFAGAIRRAYRNMPATMPAILFINEVRDSETAVEVVKAAANGMLVLTTVHSFDAKTALMRIASLAKSIMGDAAYLALSQALRIVVHQSLRLEPNTVGWHRGSFAGSVLLSDGPAHPLANLIRKEDFAQMAQVQQTQKLRIEQASRRNMDVDDLIKALGSNAES